MSDPTLSEPTQRPPRAPFGPRPLTRRRSSLAPALPLVLAFALLGCDPDVAEQPPGGEGEAPTTSEPVVVEAPLEGPGQAAGGFSLALPGTPVALAEGAAPIEVPVAIVRADGHDDAVRLDAIEDGAGQDGLVWRFADESLAAGETETTLSVSLPIGPLPRRPETRRLRVVASDGASAPAAEIAFETTPTERPDIYLLAGQSNMVGSPRDEAREMGPGEPDAPDPRILQLDVTINEASRFPDASAYTDVARIAAPDDRIVEALDPLHDRRDRGKDTKSGTTIGLGLSFAKAALENTTADIVLVPAAWSDTGFCLRETSRLEGGTGWNPERPDDPAFAGTLLHDRAIARTNLAIEETGGILRGILWHQGEADSEDETCARAYADNLAALAASLRSNIDPDARGEAARGPEADVPFVLATMSKGEDARGGALAPGGVFPEPKTLVDAAHRNIAGSVPLAGVVVADDLVPDNGFPCGQGFCIHFGAEALRELGVRYYRELLGLLE